MNELKLTTQPSQITMDDIKSYLSSNWTKLTDWQLNMFFNIAKSFNLNPYKREIYCIVYWNQFNIVTWYQVYIDRAMASWMLDWWNCEVLKDEKWNITGSKIVIYRKDWRQPFEWTVSMKEFAKRKADWNLQGTRATMPEFMIRKVNIWQGFRLAFPNELSWMPYLAEEITDQKDNPPEVKPVQVIEKKMPTWKLPEVKFIPAPTTIEEINNAEKMSLWETTRLAVDKLITEDTQSVVENQTVEQKIRELMNDKLTKKFEEVSKTDGGKITKQNVIDIAKEVKEELWLKTWTADIDILKAIYTELIEWL